MKKAMQFIASLAIVGMSLTLIPFKAVANQTVPTRIAGMTAAQTAAAIADQIELLSENKTYAVSTQDYSNTSTQKFSFYN